MILNNNKPIIISGVIAGLKTLKFLASTFQLQMLTDTVVYSFIKIINIEIATLIKHLSAITNNIQEEKEYTFPIKILHSSVEDFSNKDFNFTEFIYDYGYELKSGALVYGVSEVVNDYIHLLDVLKNIEEKAWLGSYEPIKSSFIGKLINTDIPQDTLMGKITNKHKMWHTGAHILDAYKPYYNILYLNKTREECYKETFEHALEHFAFIGNLYSYSFIGIYNIVEAISEYYQDSYITHHEL